MNKEFKIGLDMEGRFSLEPMCGVINLAQFEYGCVQFAFSLPSDWRAFPSLYLQCVAGERQFIGPLVLREDKKYVYVVDKEFTKEAGKVKIQIVAARESGEKRMTMLKNTPEIRVHPSVADTFFEQDEEGNPTVVDVHTIEQIYQKLDAINALLVEKADKSEVYDNLATKAEKDVVLAICEDMNTKADKSVVETVRRDADTALATLEEKADKAELGVYVKCDIIWEGVLTESLRDIMLDFDYYKYREFEFSFNGFTVTVPSKGGDGTTSGILVSTECEGAGFPLFLNHLNCTIAPSKMSFSRPREMKLNLAASTTYYDGRFLLTCVRGYF